VRIPSVVDGILTNPATPSNRKRRAELFRVNRFSRHPGPERMSGFGVVRKFCRGAPDKGKGDPHQTRNGP